MEHKLQNEFGKSAAEKADAVVSYSTSPERMEAIRARVASTEAGSQLIQLEEQCADAPVFDAQLPTVGRLFKFPGGRKSHVAINPTYPDDEIVSFYAHELRHLWQNECCETSYFAHPLVMAENILMISFVTEADAYLNQCLFAGDLARKGDRAPAGYLTGLYCGEKELPEAGVLPADKDGFEAHLNGRFWDIMRTLTWSQPYVEIYFESAMGVLRFFKEKYKNVSLEGLQELEGQSQDMSRLADALKPMSLVQAGEHQVGYLMREDSATFFDRFFDMMPVTYKQRFQDEKMEMIKAFYDALAEKSPKPASGGFSIWVPGQP